MDEMRPGTLMRLLIHLDSLFERPDVVVDIAHIQHVDETRRRETETLDEFGARYVHQLRRRIIRGIPPRFTLVQARPQMLYFKDALQKKQSA